jgi:hypothetical protein
LIGLRDAVAAASLACPQYPHIYPSVWSREIRLNPTTNEEYVMEKKMKRRVAGVGATGGLGLLGAVSLALLGMPGQGRSGPPQNDMIVDNAMLQEVMDSVASNLRQHYVFADKAAAIERQLRAKVQRGDFASVTSAEGLAENLTAFLQGSAGDKHLEVRYFEKPVPEPLPGDEDSAEDKVAELLHAQRFNTGVSGFTRLHGNIGYVDLHEFGRPKQMASEKYAEIMALVGDTKALIVDLRECGGGDPETVMLFASYFFDKPTHLNDVYWRDENRTEARWTDAEVPGKKYGETRKVYLLTSSDTFSGCEDLAYAMKNAGRATLIGETSGGGAHAGSPHRLSAHFMMFVPSGRPINPVTHSNWEGVGVTPDIEASAKNALDVAQVAALKSLIAAETDPEWRGRLQRALADLE